jgi:hypothetical protein
MRAAGERKNIYKSGDEFTLTDYLITDYLIMITGFFDEIIYLITI